jgi:uncharacterized membrane protein
MKKLSGQANHQAEQLGGKAAEGAKQQLLGGGGGGGGMLSTVGKAASKLLPGGGKGGGQKGGKTRRLPIQRWTDVAVPVNKAYDAWTTWEEWPKFMHRVLEVKPDEEEDSDDDNDKIHVSEKIWFWTREWDGEITEQRKNDRIAWKTVSGVQHSGVVSFHKLDDNLTRVMVDMDFLPTGVFEKMASGMRFVKRAVQSDLARFKAYVEFGDAEGLEYKSSPAEMEQNRDGGGDEDEQKEKDEPRGEGDADEQKARGSSGESSDSSENGDRDRERQNRENRREERRKSLAES